MFTDNTILEGDCTDILTTFPSETVDLVVTDPPYLVNYKDRSGRSVLNDNCHETILSSFPALYRVMKPSTFCISFYGWGKVDVFFKAWREAGFTPVGHIVWKKNYASRSGYLRYRHEQAYVLAKGHPQKPMEPIDDVRDWEYTGNKSHPTEKAVGILKPLIETFSNPGDLVRDPFAGSGSTAVAAAFLGRRYLGVELDPQYCAVANKRLAGVSQYLNLPSAA